MLKEGRVRLRCSKELRSGHIDSFTVIVAANDVQNAMKMYESMGYKVTKKEGAHGRG